MKNLLFVLAIIILSGCSDIRYENSIKIKFVKIFPDILCNKWKLKYA